MPDRERYLAVLDAAIDRARRARWLRNPVTGYYWLALPEQQHAAQVIASIEDTSAAAHPARWEQSGSRARPVTQRVNSRHRLACDDTGDGGTLEPPARLCGPDRDSPDAGEQVTDTEAASW